MKPLHLRPRYALLALMGLMATPAVAQLKLPQTPRPSIANPDLVIEYRGAKLEVLPSERARPTLDSAGRRVMHRVTSVASSSPIDSRHQGVVFNHAMQQRGYITGEIAFRMKAGRVPEADSALFPGLKKITADGLYEVLAQTPAQFVALTRQLQGDARIEWVEPVVVYGPAAPTSAAH